MTRRFWSIWVFCSIALLAGAAPAADKAADKDPLAKYSDENLLDIGFCFNTFCQAIVSKDAKVAAALIDELPKDQAKLDLNKEADKLRFLKAYAAYEGAELVSSQKIAIGGIGEVKFKYKNGKDGTLRMQRVGGRWKLTF